MPSTRHDRPVTPALDPCPSARGQSKGKLCPANPPAGRCWKTCTPTTAMPAWRL